MPGPGRPVGFGGPGGHHRGPGGPGFGGHHHRPPMGGGMHHRPPMHHHHHHMGGGWHRPYRNRGCCGCLFPVIGTIGAFIAMIAFLF